MPATDLFTWLDAVWNKTRPEGTPPIFLMHRFLASQRQCAIAARYLQLEQRNEPHIQFSTWQGLVPKQQTAPRLKYVVPKKPPAAEELTIRMMQVLAERRTVVEEMLGIFELMGCVLEVYTYFGIEPPVVDEQVEPTKRGGGGLLEALEES